MSGRADVTNMSRGTGQVIQSLYVTWNHLIDHMNKVDRVAAEKMLISGHPFAGTCMFYTCT